MKVPCPTCFEKYAKEAKPIWSFGNYFKAIKSGMVDPIVQKFRISLCKACMEVEVNDKGRKLPKRLFRNVPRENGKPHCGEPIPVWQRLWNKRKQFNWGCGCNLEDKVKWRASECPRGKWGPNEYLGPGILIEQVSHKTKWIEDVIDLHTQCRTNKKDCNGIGDIVCATHVAAALKEQTGKRVRIVVIPRNVPWASAVWPIEDVEVEGSMTRAKDQRWTVPRSWIQSDITAMRDSIGRAEQWSKNAGANGDLGKVNINYDEEALLWAQEELRGPLEENKPIILMAPFAYSLQRTWPMTRWIELVEVLKEAGYEPRVLDSHQGKDRTGYMPCVRYWGQPAEKVIALLRYSSLYIGNDSGLAHYTSVMQKHTIVVCAPTVGELAFAHYDPTYTHVLQADGECTGCTYQKARGFQLKCAPDCELMWNVKVRHVMDLITEYVPIKEGGGNVRFCNLGGRGFGASHTSSGDTDVVVARFGRHQSGGVSDPGSGPNPADLAREEEAEAEPARARSPGRTEDWNTAYVRDHDTTAEGGLHGPQANERGAQVSYGADPDESEGNAQRSSATVLRDEGQRVGEGKG